MSIQLPPLYHWSPTEVRQKIIKRGLKPTCHTAVWVRPDRDEKPRHHESPLEEQTILCVCLGTSALTAWAYSGAISGETGSSWDLWEVEPELDDEVHYRPHFGTVMDELRIANRIPKSRIWLVGTRIVGKQHMSVLH